MSAKKLVVMGFGGHARSVADVALACGYTSLLFVDDHAGAGEHFLGHPVVRHLPAAWGLPCDAIAALGDNQRRHQLCDSIERQGLRLVSLVSPLASCGAGSHIGPGCFVGHHAHIGPMAHIGRACIINTGATVEHECRVGDHSHVAVHATLAGRSTLGAFCMLGASATVIDGLQVADGVTIGAGALVRADITETGTYVGVPVRKLK